MQEQRGVKYTHQDYLIHRNSLLPPAVSFQTACRQRRRRQPFSSIWSNFSNHSSRALVPPSSPIIFLRLLPFYTLVSPSLGNLLFFLVCDNVKLLLEPTKLWPTIGQQPPVLPLLLYPRRIGHGDSFAGVRWIWRAGITRNGVRRRRDGEDGRAGRSSDGLASCVFNGGI